MGNKSGKTGEKNKEEVLEIITNINSITENDLFMKKTKLYIEFGFDSNFFQTILSNKIIIAKVVSIPLYNQSSKYSYLDNIKYYLKTVKLDVSQLFNFYNCLMTSISIFYRNRIKERYSNKNRDDEPNDVCPICEEKKVSIMLECYHFFCENCIKTWLFNKTNSCPLCRLMINVGKDSQEIFKSRQWDVVDQLDQVELDKENEAQLNALITTLFK